MAKFQTLRILTSVIAVGLIFVIAVISSIIATNFMIGLLVFSFLLVGFFLQGLREIPADPPRRAIPMFLGAFIDAESGGTSLGPGWTFFPLAGIIFNHVLFDASQINLEISIQERTPDNGNVTVDPFFTYIVNPDHPVWFIQAGGKAGVELKFSERVDGRLREWIASNNEGPLTWMEARQSNGLAMDVIIQKLFPRHLPEIPEDVIEAIPDGDEIPISAFIKYFTGRPALSDQNPKEVGVQQMLDNLRAADPDVWIELRKIIRARITFTEDVKGGKCHFPIDNLGIVITLAGIGNIDPDGATAEAADKVARARQEAVVETIKSDNFQEQVEKFALAHGGDVKAATEAMQLLRGIAKKDIKESQVALRADNVQALLEWGGPIGAAIAELIASRNRNQP